MAGGSVRDLRRRIRSVKSTQKITRAMKLVAASKLRRAQADMESARPYAAGIRDLLSGLRRRVGVEAHPLLMPRVGARTLLVVVTADRGLAGSFNMNVIKAAMQYLREHAGGGRQVTLQLVGRKGRDFFRKRPFPVRKTEADVFRRLDFSISKGIAADLMTAFLDEGFDEIVVLSNRFKTVMSQDLVFDQLLPAGGGAEGEEVAGPGTDYIYEPDAATLLGAIVPRAVEVAVHQALLESYASEMGARMVAMENATKNAGEMIDRLTLLMNRTRQAAITKELIEIVSGASALAAAD
jgi:F-type H+-transporting ATPase subunit gamma